MTGATDPGADYSAGTIDDDRIGLGGRLEGRDSSAHFLSSQKVDRRILG